LLTPGMVITLLTLDMLITLLTPGMGFTFACKYSSLVGSDF